MKHVFPVNLAQIRSAVTEIFDAQTKNEKLELQMFYNIDRTQAAVSLHSRHPRLRRNGPLCCWMTSFAAYGVRDALQ